MPDGTFKFKTAPFPKNSSNLQGSGSPEALKKSVKKKPPATNPPAANPPADPNLTMPDPIKASLDNHTKANLDQTKLLPQDAPNLGLPAVDDPATGDESFELHSGESHFDAAPMAGSATSPSRIGPYRIVKLLGQGGMGSVFLANQTTLDRMVALKVVRTHLAKHPSVVARFTREAYAAAQLVHPNVVQIYDMGDEKGDCYFSMELVDGASLADIVRKKKSLDPEQAARYILHAARGLQCAHDAGMVHRDIKPANLLVNRDGVVKVADLGLVKVGDLAEIKGEVDQAIALSASLDLTRAGSTVGTPYYMAPEQAKSSIDVDHRADIYSLGCTFYVLLTGKRPFEGKSLQEVVSKHNMEPLVVPSKIVERVPESLSNIVARMMAKRPEDRYQNIGEMITDVEGFLGLSSATAFTPREEDADLIEKTAKSFNASPLIRIRGLLPLAFAASSILIAFALLFVDWRWATGFMLMPLFAVGSYFLISGAREKGPLFEKSRELFLRLGIFNWIKLGFATALLVVAAFLLSAILQWGVLALVGVGLGAAMYFCLDLPIKSSRSAPLKTAETLVRNMRLKGMDESTIQMFVAKYCGKHWEEFFENLFSYSSKRKIRDELKQSDLGKKKAVFRGWRDVMVDNLSARNEVITSGNQRQHLQNVEEAGLVAQGVEPSEAKEQATQMAAALVDHGDSIKVAALKQRIAELDPQVKRIQQRQRVKAMLAEARSGKYKKEPTKLEGLAPVLNSVFGSFSRFLLGCILIVGCLLWARQNALLSKLAETAVETQNIIANGDPNSATTVAENSMTSVKDSLNAIKTEPLKFPILGALFYNFNPLVAGLILVGSTIVFGWRMSVFVLPAALITVLGESLGIPELVPLGVNNIHITSTLIGIGLFAAGIVFGRREF